MVSRSTTVAALFLVASSFLVTRTSGSGPVDYSRDIKPLLRERCYACHGALKQESDLRLDSGKSIRHERNGYAVVLPGQPDESPLLKRIASSDASIRMPPEGEPLTAAQVSLIRQWIAEGAESPAGEEPEEDPAKHWAFQPPIRPALPGTHGTASANPIDCFIDARLEEDGLQPGPSSPRHVLLRRVTLDLIGLPPTGEELQAFLTDDSPTAYEEVVDRLLNDPRHGERWARHWMDVWRYSDWFGRRHVPDVWNSAPQIWRWRDWIVQSLNADVGYDQMVRQMLAADEVDPANYEAGVATGYLIRNWYALNPNDWMRSNVEHVGKAFLGLTFNCAHCHDHKYDPISQEDYFRLRAFFEPIYVRQDRVPGEADPGAFQDYDYSTLRKVQRLGSVRIFDKSPEAATWFYSGGDERNRDKERGPIMPGVPAFLEDIFPQIESVPLPVEAWYPGLREEILETMRAERRRAVTAAQERLRAARETLSPPSPDAVARKTRAEAELAAAMEQARASGHPGALSGTQSVLFDASAGRRIINNSLDQITEFPDGTTIRFQLLLLTPEHFNFQLARDAAKGLTAGYVGFEQGRIVSYRPGSFTEFDVGGFDFSSGQRRFEVELVVRTEQDAGLLSVRSLNDGANLVESVPVAINGWNPVDDATKAITFDAHTGSRAVIDDVRLTLPDAGPSGGAGGAVLLSFDFEPPLFEVGADVVGIDGWLASSFCSGSASSRISCTAGNEVLESARVELAAAQRAVQASRLAVLAAQADVSAAQAELASLETRIEAERARYQLEAESDPEPLMRRAARLELETTVERAEAERAASEADLAAAESRPSDDDQRQTELKKARQRSNAARKSLQDARANLAAAEGTTEYSPLSPQYPRTSTGRRRALAAMMTDRRNPLTARVAVNHVWMRHVHTPLVPTVENYGRSGKPPTHPQLLDWLAVEFMDSGWSLKHLHRLIVTSRAYRRTSSPSDRAGREDPENLLYSHANTGRMEAEVIRDSLLFLGGMLDGRMGGQELENSGSLSTNRRSLYYAVYPEQGGQSPLGELFDGPSPMECYRRTRTVIPQQALALTNSELIHTVANRLTGRILSRLSRTNSTEADREFCSAVFAEVLGRPPTGEELAVCIEFLRTPKEAEKESAYEGLVRALLSHNDFITVR